MIIMATAIVGFIVLAIVILVMLKLHSDKKKGKSSCGCKCSGCPNSSICHEKNSKPKV